MVASRSRGICKRRAAQRIGCPRGRM